jgi:hypothetical protein
MGELNWDTATGSTNWVTASNTYSIDLSNYNIVPTLTEPEDAEPAEESALEWLDRRVAEVSVKL